MASATQPAPVSKVLLVIGWIMGILPAGMLVMSAAMKFMKPVAVLKGFEHLEWPQELALALGIVELACTIMYLIPHTAVLGAILLTGYLGGAIATHVRIGDQFIPPIALGILLWGGLWLRDPRLRALLPLRR